MTVTFCGHAEISEPEAVKRWLRETVSLLIAQGADTFFLGGYGAFDLMAASVLQELKLQYPEIKSVLALAYLNQTIDKGLYDETTFPPLEFVPKRYAIRKRNEFMVQWSDVIVAYVCWPLGGAAATLQYARRKRKRILSYASI